MNQAMTLEELGYHAELKNHRVDYDFTSFELGRVISEHKERYIVKTTLGEYDAEIIGH